MPWREKNAWGRQPAVTLLTLMWRDTSLEQIFLREAGALSKGKTAEKKRDERHPTTLLVARDHCCES